VLKTLLSLFFWGACAHAGPVANVDASGVILHGYDAVTYFGGKAPVKGDPKFQTQYDGATYLFANDADKTEFLKDPKKYAPQFGGWCAYAVADSKSKVDIDPKSFVIQNGRLLVFYNGVWADTRKKWQKSPDTYLQKADANWPATSTKAP